MPADHVGGIHQRFGGQQRQRAHGQHGLRAIDQRDRLLGFEHQRLDLRALERVAAGNARAFFVDAFSFANQGQREMRQRSEISARADAALRRHKRSDAAVEHFAERVDDDGAHTGITFGKRVCPQQHHGASFGNGQRLADADSMRAHEIHLQLADLIAGDAHVAEFAHASGDGIRQLIVCDQRVHHGARPVDRFARIRRQQHRAAVASARDFTHRFESQVVTVDVECVQKSFQFPFRVSKFQADVVRNDKSC